MQKKQAGMEILFNWWRFSNSESQYVQFAQGHL